MRQTLNERVEKDELITIHHRRTQNVTERSSVVRIYIFYFSQATAKPSEEAAKHIRYIYKAYT